MHADPCSTIRPSTPARRSPRGLAWATAVLAMLLAGCAATAASPDAYGQEEAADDPPARVGAVSALRGPVDLSAESGGAWEPAQVNQPVTTGTSLFAKPGSQAELRIGSTSVRLDGNTQAVFSQLDDHAIVVDVAQGTVRARVRNLAGGDQFMLVADNVRAEAQGPGDYRVTYDPDRRAYTVRTLAGRMKIVTPGNSFNLEAGQETLVEAGGSALQLRAMGPRDDFDAWAEGRDREQDRLAAVRYVSPETTGIEALDGHGRWDVVGDYGPVWYPSAVPYGWAPYRYGRWAYVRPWGWTWVDDAPWGFAPFHYGRWAQIGGSWGWVPGPIVPRPVWAPALVGYVGSGGVSVSVGIGSGRPVGWFPLGPREVYHPPYRYGPRYRQQVNVINVNTVVVNPPAVSGDRRVGRPPEPGRGAYRYARQPDAVTMVREEQFRGARPIGRDRMDLTPQQAAGLQPVIVAPPGRGRDGRPGAGVAPGGVPSPLPRAELPAPVRDPREGYGRMVPRSESNGDRTIYVPPAAAEPRTPYDRGQYNGRRNDPRFNDDDRGDRGFGRGPQPQRPPQYAPPPAAVPVAPRPGPAPAAQPVPRPAPPPQAAPPQAQPQPQPQAPQRFRQYGNPNRESEDRQRER